MENDKMKNKMKDKGGMEMESLAKIGEKDEELKKSTGYEI
jgi:hypothetical protein